MTYGHLRADCLYTGNPGSAPGPAERSVSSMGTLYLYLTCAHMIDNSRKGMCSGSRNLFKFCLGPGHIVLDGPLSTQKRGQPHCSAHVYGGQRVRWIKMPLGKEVGLSAQATFC